MPTQQNEKDIYEVETILRRSNLFYYIKWRGYGPEENSWEHYSDIINCDHAIEEFEHRLDLNKLTPKQYSMRRANDEISCDPEEIINQRKILGRTEYLIRFHNEHEQQARWYPQWQSYRDLTEEYKIQMTLRSQNGATHEVDIDKRNGTYDSEVIMYFQYYAKYLKLNTDKLQLEYYLGPEKEDKSKDRLYLLSYKQHFYVYLFLNSSNKYYIADGVNECRTNYKIHEKITGKKLSPLEFHRQKGTDHCGSSAVAIALKMVRDYNNNELPQGPVIGIKFNKAYEMICKDMHLGPTISIRQRRDIDAYNKMKRMMNL